MNLNRILTQIAICFLLVTTQLHGQEARNNYNAVLELDDFVLHGAGQSPDAFKTYFDHMPINGKPNIYMYYIQLRDLQDKFWVDQLLKELDRYEGQFILPQIGLSMASGFDPNDHYEDDVAAGLYDDQIGYLLEGLSRLGRPSYLRIGYECNGTAWNGYAAETYQLAFRRISDRIKMEGLEVATVWCIAVGGGTDENYTNYYPGNEYVDWWSIDLFSVGHFTEPVTTQFMIDADSEMKPVMIGETTPRFIGADDEKDWEDWFVTYFDFIEDNPGVKASCYINWDWGEFEQWSDWGNAQLSENDFVRFNYIHKLRSEIYFHASQQSDFRKLLPYGDDLAPNVVNLEGSDMSELPIRLNWNASTDANNVIYVIYKNSDYYATTYDTEFTDLEYVAGDVLNYQVTAMDWAGNESELSNSQTFELPDTICKSANSTFEGDIFPWSLDNYSGAQSSFQVSEDDLEINILNSTGTNWHVQLVQETKILEQNEYYVESTIQSTENGVAAIIVQQNHDPFGLPLFQNLNLDNMESSYSSNKIVAAEDDDMNVGIYLGELAAGTKVNIGNLKLFEINGRETFVENSPPTSIAGEDFSYTDPSAMLNLDGSESFDQDGSISSYSWEQVSGKSIITIDNPNAEMTSLSDVAKGEYIFRLTITDNDGASSVDDLLVKIDALPQMVSADDISHLQEIKSWPNPADGFIHFEVPNLQGGEDLEITIVDILGRVVENQNYEQVANSNHLVSIDISSLVIGTYLCSLKVGKKHYVQKFMVK